MVNIDVYRERLQAAKDLKASGHKQYNSLICPSIRVYLDKESEVCGGMMYDTDPGQFYDTDPPRKDIKCELCGNTQRVTTNY